MSLANVPLQRSPDFAVFDETVLVLRTLMVVPDGMVAAAANAAVRATAVASLFQVFTFSSS
jgi:hypothetical protein